MRKHLSYIAVLFVLVLVGCEGSPYPLSAPGDVPVRSELLGNWQTTDEDMPSFYRMYESEVDGLRFANIQCLGCEEEEAESSDDVVLAFLEAVETGDALFSEEWEWSRVDR
ncbi:MAG: hypothetical protein ACI9W4_001263 [Rhodothermales bacterium]|jgi:hypothetical protein